MNRNTTSATDEQTTLEKRVYTVEEIQAILEISRNAAYELVRSNVFHSVRIGKTYRVSKLQFDRWLESEEESK